MYCTTQIGSDLYYVGASDRRIALFENVYPVEQGVSYNSYLIDDEKTVLLDTVDHAVSSVFFENILHVLNGKQLDYLIVNHMEPDHAATIGEILLRYPSVTVVGNAKTAAMLNQFFDVDITDKLVTVKEGDKLETGRHTLTFVMAPMVHWPEVMVTYDITEKILFSADAFGTFGALSGNLFADEKIFFESGISEARRYYANIVGKYGVPVQTLLKKAGALDIKMICPLHGPMWCDGIGKYIDKYALWSSYTPEDKAVMIAYASIYGGTENAADILAAKLADRGVRDIGVFDVSAVHTSYLVAQAFRCSHLVFASSTYNGGVFPNMEALLLDLKVHNLQNRTVALIENGSWASASGTLMRKLLGEMKNMSILDETVKLKSTVKQDNLSELDALADAIVKTM